MTILTTILNRNQQRSLAQLIRAERIDIAVNNLVMGIDPASTDAIPSEVYRVNLDHIRTRVLHPEFNHCTCNEHIDYWYKDVKRLGLG